MNQCDIDRAVERFKNHTVLGKATRFLAGFRDEVNAHSDGWAYWKPPFKAADQLMRLIEHPDTATEATFKKALQPIKAFYTRRGTAAGMKFPDLKEALPAKVQLQAAAVKLHNAVADLTRCSETFKHLQMFEWKDDLDDHITELEALLANLRVVLVNKQ